LKQRFSDLPETEFKQLTLKRLKECHNRNY
jgi:hypothetical protein